MRSNIREAVPHDCTRMMELIQELAYYEKAPEEVTVSLDHFIDAGFGQHPVWKAFVAEVDGVVVGMSLCYVRYSTWKGRRLYLEDLIVSEAYRGQQIGSQLLERTIAYAKENNFSGIMWQVLDWNKPAIDFYKRYPVDFDAEWINVTLNFEK